MIILIIYLQMQTKILSTNMHPLSKSVQNMANLVTTSRIFILLIAMTIFKEDPFSACLLCMVSTLLDYADGKVARAYNCCTYFGQILDWFADITGSAVMFILLYSVAPQLSGVYFILLAMEIFMMILDITAKAKGFNPLITANQFLTYSLKWSMIIGKTGYAVNGHIGYFNQISYQLCGASQIMYLVTSNAIYYWIFLINLPLAITFVLMEIGYIKLILNSWNQQLVGVPMVIFKPKI